MTPEEYIRHKQWNYDFTGNQIKVETCPFCNKGDFKFFINADNWLYDCKRATCDANKGGNKYTLLKHTGDLHLLNSASTSSGGTGKRRDVEMEGIPDIELMHRWLLENQDLMNYLYDVRGWSHQTIEQMKIGIQTRYVGEIGEEAGCWSYPYFIGGKCEMVKFRTLPGNEKGFSKLTGRPNYLYNQDAIKPGMDYLLLVEGEPDTITVLNLGEDKVVGVPGAGMKNDDWGSLLQQSGKRILLFDNDAAGQAGAKAFAKKFDSMQFYSVVIPEFDLAEPVEEDGEVRTKGKDITEWASNNASGPKTLLDLQELIASAQSLGKPRVKRKTFGDEGFEGYSLADAAGWDDLDFIVPQIIMRGGLTLVYAAPGAGKSTLIKQLVHCVSAGKDFLDVPTKQSTVLFFELDEPIKWTSEVLRKKMGTADDAPIVLHDTVNRKTFADGVINHLNNHPEIGLVVIDTLNKVSSAEEINSYSQMDAELEKLKDILRAHPTVGMVVIHHSSKGGNKPLGSQAIEGACDLMFEITKDEDYENINRLRTIKSRVCVPLPKLCLQWNPDTHLYSVIAGGCAEPEESKGSDKGGKKSSSAIKFVESAPSPQVQELMQTAPSGVTP